jgi:hypothetical protein
MVCLARGREGSNTKRSYQRVRWPRTNILHNLTRSYICDVVQLQDFRERVTRLQDEVMVAKTSRKDELHKLKTENEEIGSCMNEVMQEHDGLRDRKKKQEMEF